MKRVLGVIGWSAVIVVMVAFLIVELLGIAWGYSPR